RLCRIDRTFPDFASLNPGYGLLPPRLRGRGKKEGVPIYRGVSLVVFLISWDSAQSRNVLMTVFAPLPIDAATPDLVAALGWGTTAVLVAPPGAGKTTRVPLVLAAEPWAVGKKILVLEPRRLAARAAAARMAQTLGERVGDTVGYRVRF